MKDVDYDSVINDIEKWKTSLDCDCYMCKSIVTVLESVIEIINDNTAFDEDDVL